MNSPSAESLPFVEHVYRFDSIDSTNTFAKALDRGPGKGLFVVTARRQSAGRGQRENSFYSDSDTGLWVSIVVQLETIDAHFGVNRALALAACRTAGAVAGVEAHIKWPNDIVVNEKKLAGILLESVPGAQGRIVAGLGMNVNTGADRFPEEIRGIATSLAMESGYVSDIETVLVTVLQEFDELRQADESTVHMQYERALAGVGGMVRIGDVTGVFEGVGMDGRARVRCDGTLRYFSSGPMRFTG